MQTSRNTVAETGRTGNPWLMSPFGIPVRC